MRIDASLPPVSLRQIPEIARGAERLGFDGLWTSETQHDPFLPLALTASVTERLQFGTAVAIGFARSPATLAYTGWDLAEASGGRFMLGLGTQVRAHIERRYGMAWPESPVGKLRELLAAVRAFWRAWQSGERLNFRGEHYRLTLMSPFFNPGPISHPDIPIYIAGVNLGLCRLAGEAADGFHVHPYHSVRYLKEVVRPAIAEGVARSGRAAQSVRLSVPAFVATDPGQTDWVRSQVAFYASTPSYRPVMALHGWGEVADELQGLARRGDWGAMGRRISPEMLEAFAVVCSPDELGAALAERYHGLADRLSLYLPFFPGAQDAFWRRFLTDVRDAA
jgi:probable F420-dependent oxidoreductase